MLSSGALADSVSYGASVIGPNIGAFADLSKEGVIKTYNDLDDLKSLLENCNNRNNINDRVDRFINLHTWEKFSMALQARLKTI